MTGIVHHPHGPRVYLAGRRVHHATAGPALAAAGALTRNRMLVALGLAAMVHDAPDFPWRDRDNHDPRRKHR